MAVAKLLEKRQAEVTSGGGNSESDPGDDKDSTASTPPGLPVFQPLLMRFLDYDAPILGMLIAKIWNYFYTGCLVVSKSLEVWN